MKKITNIVIYKSIEDGKEVINSCIFYDDGTTKFGDYAEGRAAIKEVAKEKNITTKDQLRAIMNKDTVYTMTEEEFKNRYNSFLPESVEEEVEEEENVIAPVVIENNNEEITTEAPKEEKAEEVVYEENYDGSDNYFYENPEINEEIKDETVEREESSSKNSGCIKVLAGTIVAGLIIGGVAYALTRCSKLGKVLQEPTTTTTTTTLDNTTTTTNETEYTATESSTYVVNNNDLYDNYTYNELLNVTTNQFQKKSMIDVHSGIIGFNREFANNYLESGHDIKAALTFDEVVALQQAYNNYSVDEVRAYFNGYEVDAVNMSNAYKSASLQLMGAYVIETSKNPVDMSMLIDSQEGIDFYNRYHKMYLAAKEAKGDEQIRLVKEFYASVEKDFPITEEVRTDGISHSEAHNSLKDYQLAVAPMIASAEMIFQNLEVDYTLDDTKVDFLNDIGLCNHADDKFERLETITLTAYEDNTNPLYEQYKKAITLELTKTNDYVIDDAHRELSNLRRFQEIVNGDPLWKHKTTYEGEYGEEYTDYEEYTEVIEWEESTTEYTTVTTREEKPIPEEEKEKIDAEIEKENEEGKKQAEEEAEKERERQQKEEDEKAKEVEKEVEEENKQLEEDIKEINEQIDENNKDTDKTNDEPVNENDYEHIDFDDEYTNNQGNLDGSVENVTTDGTGADEDLPDPNVTGQKFDSQATTTTATTETTTTETTTTETETTDTNTSETTTTETTTTTTEYTEEDMTDVYVEWAGEDGAYIEYDVDYVPYDADGNPIYTEESGNQKTR